MRTIKTEDEFLEVTASYIYKMIIRDYWEDRKNQDWEGCE